jgi:hypothetical protein
MDIQYRYMHAFNNTPVWNILVMLLPITNLQLKISMKNLEVYKYYKNLQQYFFSFMESYNIFVTCLIF